MMFWDSQNLKFKAESKIKPRTVKINAAEAEIFRFFGANTVQAPKTVDPTLPKMLSAFHIVQTPQYRFSVKGF